MVWAIAMMKSLMPKTHYTTTPMITAYDQDGFVIDNMRFGGAVAVVGAEQGFGVRAVSLRGEIIGKEDLQLFCRPPIPHLVVLGVGETMTHPFYDLRGCLAELGLKGEILPTSAACRAWNLLLSEGRKVALLARPAAREL